MEDSLIVSLRALSLVVLVALYPGCGGGDPGPAVPESDRGAESALAAVDELITHLNTPDFESASRLAMPGQAALASLAEGATFSDVAEALRGGDAEVSANFWSGFAQGAGTFLSDGVATREGGTVTRDDTDYSMVLVIPDTGTERAVLTRDLDGFRIDLFASFGAGLAGRMVPAVERLLTTNTEDARLVLSRLREIVPSLWVALEQEGLDPDLGQDLVRLIEVITR